MVKKNSKNIFGKILIFGFLIACVFKSASVLAEDLNGTSFAVQLVQSVPEGTALYYSGIPQTYEVWEKLFLSAQEKIQIGVFYMIDEGPTKLSRILDIIEKKARGGVKLQIVSDTVFYRNYPDVLDRFSEIPGADVRIIDLRSRTGGVMHAKYFIVDGKHFYAGSANFDWRSIEHIRELGLAGTCEETAKSLSRIFEIDFNLAGGKDIHFNHEPLDYQKLSAEVMDEKMKGDILVSATPPPLTPENILNSEASLIKMMNSAKNDIFIDMFQYGLTSSYAEGYYDELDRAIRRAASRGVSVKMLVSNWGLKDSQLQYLKSLQVLPNVEVRYTAIPQSSAGYISFARVSHTKMLVIDKTAGWLGSTNWQPGYFDGSRNAGVIIGKEDIVRDMRGFFLTAWESPYAHKLEINKNYAPPHHSE